MEESVKPSAVLKELREGDYQWGTWLAFLRPHKDVVAELLPHLKFGGRPETMLALGKSGDRRALEPLLGLLKQGGAMAGYAAQALGHFGSARPGR